MNKLFNQSYIERDLEMTGGNRVISKIFGNTLDFSGVIVPSDNGYKLIADIVPDQSRIFSDIKVRIDGVDVTNFDIHLREDGKKVISVIFNLLPEHFKDSELQIDVIWNYSDEDLARPDVFTSKISVDLGSTEYNVENLAKGLQGLTGSYGVQDDDFWKPIGFVNLDINPIKKHYTGLIVRYYPNYKDYPNRYEISNYDNMVSCLPFKISKKIFVDLDTLKVQNKKFDLIWTTECGELIETFMVDTDTIGYSEGFSAPIPIEINRDAYKGVDLKNIYRNFVFEPEFTSYYKGNHELRDKNLSFRAKLPIGLSVYSFTPRVLINGEESSYKQTPIVTDNYTYYQYDVDLSGVEDVTSVEIAATAVYYNGKEVNYKVILTELF